MLSYKVFNVHQDTTFYYLAKDWWEKRGWKDIPSIISLPETGIMIYDNNRPICAGWVYKTDSVMAQISFIVADGLPNKNKPKAIKMIIKIAELLMKSQGFLVLRIPTTSKSICKLIKKEQYEGELCYEFLKII